MIFNIRGTVYSIRVGQWKKGDIMTFGHFKILSYDPIAILQSTLILQISFKNIAKCKNPTKIL